MSIYLSVRINKIFAYIGNNILLFWLQEFKFQTPKFSMFGKKLYFWTAIHSMPLKKSVYAHTHTGVCVLVSFCRDFYIYILSMRV